MSFKHLPVSFIGCFNSISDCANMSFVVRPDIASFLSVAIIRTLNVPIAISVNKGLFSSSTIATELLAGSPLIVEITFVPLIVLPATVIFAGPTIVYVVTAGLLKLICGS